MSQLPSFVERVVVLGLGIDSSTSHSQLHHLDCYIFAIDQVPENPSIVLLPFMPTSDILNSHRALATVSCLAFDFMGHSFFVDLLFTASCPINNTEPYHTVNTFVSSHHFIYDSYHFQPFPYSHRQPPHATITLGQHVSNSSHRRIEGERRHGFQCDLS